MYARPVLPVLDTLYDLILLSTSGAFQLYDINKDGMITYDEMLQIVQSIYKMTGEMVKLPSDEDTPEKVRCLTRLTCLRRPMMPL